MYNDPQKLLKIVQNRWFSIKIDVQWPTKTIQNRPKSSVFNVLWWLIKITQIRGDGACPLAPTALRLMVILIDKSCRIKNIIFRWFYEENIFYLLLRKECITKWSDEFCTRCSYSRKIVRCKTRHLGAKLVICSLASQKHAKSFEIIKFNGKYKNQEERLSHCCYLTLRFIFEFSWCSHNLR